MITRSRLRRWHVWLGWIVALPFLFWTVSGLVMVWKPIEEVRGNHLMAAPQPMRLQGVAVPPAMADVPLSSLKLEQRANGTRDEARLSSKAPGSMLILDAGFMTPPKHFAFATHQNGQGRKRTCRPNPLPQSHVEKPFHR